MAGIAFYEDGQKSENTLVLGHSLGSDHRVWEEVTKSLPKSWRIIRWEMPGHGSSKVLREPASMGSLVSELLAGLDSLGVETFHIGGISLGGMVSLAIAQSVPERTQSLAMLDSGPVLLPPEQWTARASQVRQQGMGSIAAGTMDRWFTPDFREGPHAHRYMRTLGAFLNCDPEGYAQCCEIIATTDLRPNLAKVRAQTLILTGSDDDGMTPGQAEELASAVPGAGGNYRVIAGARHMTCVEHPAEVATALADNVRAAV